MTGKLVRDRIPELDRRRGGTARFRTADEDEMGVLLIRKIVEGHRELTSASWEDVPGRTADLIEAVLAYARNMGYPEDLVDHVRRIKLKHHGGFTARQVLVQD